VYLFSKSFSPQNFVFANRLRTNKLHVGQDTLKFSAIAGLEDVYHLSVEDLRWKNAAKSSELFFTPSPTPLLLKGRHSSLVLGQDGSVELKGRQYRTFLASLPMAGFGLSGQAWMFQFRQRPDMQFYGMGEKSTPFEKSDRSHRFWNTDVWADHGTSRAKDQAYDPDYLSVPYVIIKRGNTYAGILLDNPHPSVIAISPKLNIANQMMTTEHELPYFFLGAEDGPPSLYILFGPSLAELTIKLQKLVGLPPLPPLWSLGHHQCRWGYRGTQDLNSLADNFDRLEFPNDGLWLDIDYMRGYRVFTFDPEHFSNPNQDIRALQERGYRIIPILDPGVKREPGYSVYDSGHALGAFCLNAAGTEFTGVVWPGYSVFPDFSLPEVQVWWAELVATFAASGPDGAWLDMNDPSTGPVDCNGMLFQHGTVPHSALHNIYASLMAEATRQGFMKARPNQRPFLISRSGFTGSQRYTAHWTGDNWSNYHHLHMSIGKSLNLALSGMAINGPDVPGFGGNCSEPLFIDWYKAGFLFPFFRNHCVRTSKDQEPWAFSDEAMTIARHYIRLRYKLLPYLYNLVIQNSERGHAVLRPLFHDFRDTATLPLSHINDQFLVGPWIMQAPFTVEDQSERDIVLPAARWWRADAPTWIEGPAHIKAFKQIKHTPLFFREGALIPMLRGTPKNNRKDLNTIELFICLSHAFTGTAILDYTSDDGESLEYQNGGRSQYHLEATVFNGEVELSIHALSEGFGVVTFIPITIEDFSRLSVKTSQGKKFLKSDRFTSDQFGESATFSSWL
jgi:alpha-glucosidase